MKRPRRLAVLAALCGTVALAGWIGAVPAGLSLLGIQSDGAPIEVSRATSATACAEHVDAPRATALDEHGVSVADIAGGTYPAVVSVLLALRQRDATGSGAHLDISMTHNLQVLGYGYFATHQAGGRAGTVRR